MGEKNNIPQIRFKEYEGKWKSAEMNKVAEFSKGHSYSKKDLVKEGKPIILYGRLYTNYESIISNVDTFAIEKPGSKYSNGSEVIVPASGETAEDIAIASVILKPGIILGGDLNIIYPNELIDSVFLALTISHGKQHKELSKKAQGKSIVHLRNSDIKETTLFYTGKDEQSKIGTYFQNLDKLITLQQQKHDKLVTFKKAMLDKMFPKEGADVPEIRFKGFKDKWEKRKLKEISIKVTEKNTPIKYCETFTNSAEHGIISQRDYFDNDISNSDNIDRYYVVKNDDFVYNPRISSFAPVGPINRNRLGRNGIMSPLYTVFRTQDVDVTFLEHFFKTDCWHTFMRLNGDTGARSDRFSIKDFLFVEMPIPFPKIEEQSQIGSYFQNLDKLISLHQQEIQKLKNIKKACLEKMFV